ncbi:MAG: hypothetical protein R3324_12460, partial [Halobacteriales archaeon]|nr:hypothetical protein [Halobacteriales archaeon]
MDDSLVITLNRDGPHSIHVGDRPFEATDSFDLVLDNRGEALHVHLHLDDDLAQTASIATGNHYVQQGAVRRVRVEVQSGPRPVQGRLEVVTGYGSERTWIDIGIVDPTEIKEGVRVDESLGRPQPTVEREPAIDEDALPVIGVAALALIIAIATLVLLDGLVVAIGALVV